MSDREQVFVIGYPKSGNTWVSRLIADYLDAPVERYKSAIPLAIEGEKRKGNYVVHQMHLRPTYEERKELIPDRYTLSVPIYNHEKLVFVMRDPRDVVVSVMHYWGIKSIDRALKAVGEGVRELANVGSISDYVYAWLRCPIIASTVRYEDLSYKPVETLNLLFADLHAGVDHDKIRRVIYDQSFNKKRAQIEIDGDERPYGKAVQLKNLRRGIVGDWRNYFNRHHAKEAHEYFGKLMLDTGYIDSEDWWKEVKL